MTAAKQRRLALEDYLAHIEEAAAMASNYVQGMTKEQFLADKKTQQAVIYNILILGEAATQIINEYDDFVATHPNIPWRELRGIRNRMAHGYFELNLDIIWDTATTALKPLSEQITLARSSLYP